MTPSSPWCTSVMDGILHSSCRSGYTAYAVMGRRLGWGHGLCRRHRSLRRLRRPGRAASRVRRRRTGHTRPGAGSGGDVPAVDAGHDRRGTARAQRDGGVHRLGRGPALRPDGAPQGCRRAWVRLLHQLRVPQGRRPDGHLGRLAAVPVARPPTPGAGRGTGRAGLGRGEPGLLRLATPRLPARGVGVAAVAGGGLACGARRSLRRRRAALRRGRRRVAAALLGRLPRAARGGRVLAGTQGTDARPAGLSPGLRVRMAYVATGALTRTVRSRGFLQLCLVVLLAGGLVTACGGEPAEQPPRKLVWSDEFEGAAGASPDPAHWVHDTGGHGWG